MDCVWLKMRTGELFLLNHTHEVGKHIDKKNTKNCKNNKIEFIVNIDIRI